MSEQKLEYFKQTLRDVLFLWGLNDLAVYGRHLGLQTPTKLKKRDLIEAIVETICGERAEKRNNRGAPIKSKRLNPELVQEIDSLIEKYFAEALKPLPVIIEPSHLTHTPEQAPEQQPEQAPETANPAVQINISVNPEKLTRKQKKILTDFLNSFSA